MAEWNISIDNELFQAEPLDTPLLSLQEPSEPGPQEQNDDLPIQLAKTGWRPDKIEDRSQALVGQLVQWLDGGEALLTNQLVVHLARGASPRSLTETVDLSLWSPLPMTRDVYLIRVHAKSFDPAITLENLRNHKDVISADLDLVALLPDEFFLRSFTKPEDFDTYQPWQWGPSGLNIEQIWGKQQGAGVNVAVIDLGFQATHAAYKAQVKAQYRVNARANLSGIDKWGAYDPWNHGTFCAGLVAAGLAEGETVKVRGAAPQAGLILIGIDQLTQSSLATALRLCAQDPAADIVTCSLASCTTWKVGATGCKSSWNMLLEQLELALDDARNGKSQDGTPIFWSTTNKHSGPISDHPLADSDKTIAVGGLTQNDSKWSGETGARLDFLAPATQIGSTRPSHDEGQSEGSSWAAPAAAGLAALLKAQKPGLTATEIKEAMAKTCRAVDGKGGGRDTASDGFKNKNHDPTVGYGALDGVGAWEELGFPKL